MLLGSLTELQRGGKRFLEIVSALVRYGFAEHLDRIEPGFVQRWLNHEDVAELASLSVGERARRACEELGPTFVKIGQVLSTRPDVVSSEVAASLAMLRSGTAPDPPEAVRTLIESEFDRPVDEVFEEFDETPVASASIGQVHRARTTDGRDVVVKVQHPGIEERLRVDFEILVKLARLLEEHDDRARAFQLERVTEETRRTLFRELEFRRELRSMQRFQEAFADDDDVRIPITYPELCTQRVLTMEFVEGYSIGDRERLLEDGHDTSHLALVGARVFLDMVFKHGAFHADPHPGNLFVQPDGTLVLLDFGMVGWIDRDLRDDLVDLLVSFVREDSRRTERAVEELAIVPPDADPERLRRDVAEFQTEIAHVPIDQVDMGALLAEFTGMLRRHRVRLPPVISMLVKVLVMLEGTARSLDGRFSLMNVLQPYCEEIASDRYSIRAMSRRSLETSREWLHLTRRLPSALDRAVRRLERGRWQVDMVHTGLEATVDRMVSGVLCAAMMLGGSVLWALEAPPLLFGVPVVGVAATLLALVHGFRLLRSIGSTPRR